MRPYCAGRGRAGRVLSRLALVRVQLGGQRDRAGIEPVGHVARIFVRLPVVVHSPPRSRRAFRRALTSAPGALLDGARLAPPRASSFLLFFGAMAFGMGRPAAT